MTLFECNVVGSIVNFVLMVCYSRYWFELKSNVYRVPVLNYFPWCRIYRKTSNTFRTLVGNKIVDHSDVVGASPVGAAPTTFSFST